MDVHARGTWLRPLLLLLLLVFGMPAGAAEGPFREGDRVAWVGSSSTKIGVWPSTVEFLLRTRHPELDLQFRRFTTGGGTFGTGLQHFDEWLSAYRPNIVIYNYGGNDAAAGREGLPRFFDEMERSVVRAQRLGARVVLVTPQAADVRKAEAEPAARRTLYAESMLAFGRNHGWTVIDVHHPLDVLQRANQAVDPSYSILKDHIHLTEPAYIAWGLFVYDRLDLPFVRTDAVLKGNGTVSATENCKIEEVTANDDGVSFTRVDALLPILPPVSLPPRLSVPLEDHSRYLLTITDLPSGAYEIRCEGKLIGVVDAASLAVGVNLNSVLLDQGQEAPWAATAQALWEGKNLDRIGKTRWRFAVRKSH